MYIKYHLTGYGNVHRLHKGKPLWFGVQTPGVLGGVISFLSPGLSFLRLLPSVLLPFHLFGIFVPGSPFDRI
jgi:hypothetical protein